MVKSRPGNLSFFQDYGVVIGTELLPCASRTQAQNLAIL